MLSYPTVSKIRVFVLWSVSLVSTACQTPYNDSPSNYEVMVQGTISYPFYLETEPLGGNGKEDKFVIRTISGNTEYVIEIPRAATDYDVTVPLAIAEPDTEPEPKIKNAELTDRELLSQFPKPDAASRDDRALLDKAFGVSESEGPRQAPSYTVGLSKVNKLYRKQKYEYALIETNNLLAYYPNSARLYKMKGSVLLRIGNLALAEKSWMRAAELAPTDPVIRKGLNRLQSQIKRRNEMARGPQVGPQQPL
mgnify:CR=1 FL=1